jgi:hypothetical protein
MSWASMHLLSAYMSALVQRVLPKTGGEHKTGGVVLVRRVRHC